MKADKIASMVVVGEVGARAQGLVTPELCVQRNDYLKEQN